MKASAFKEKPPGDSRRRGKSMFIQERLPDNDDGNCLSRGDFTGHFRARLPALDIRSVEYTDEETGQTARGFDLAMNPEGAKAPFEDLKDAHANLTGSTHIGAAVHALAERYNETKDIVHP